MKNCLYLFSILFLLSGLSLAQNELIIESNEQPETIIEKTRAYDAEQLPPVELGVIIPVDMPGVTHPLFVGVDDVTVPAYVGDVVTNDWVQAFIGAEVWGAAYDNLNDKIYFNDGSTLYEWIIGDTIVTQLGTITDSSLTTLSMVSLAFYNGTLYGTRNIANEAVYEIDPGSLIATVVIDYEDGDFDFGGLAVDPNTGEFYGTSDDTSPIGTGLYRINSDGTGTLIVAYPTGETDIDGLTISTNSEAYLITDEPGDIYVYDLVGGTFGTPLLNPWATSEVFCGGAWNSGIIPVELTSFSASVAANDVTLLWKTTTELNNSGFSIERKTAQSGFEEIAFVPGFGTTTQPKSYTYADENLQPGIYSYRLKQIDFGGTYEYSDVVEVEIVAPGEFRLEQNFPNPFNPSTKITFSLAADATVNLKVFNVLGQEVAVLLDRKMTAGIHDINFDADGLNSGVYFYRMEVNGTDGSSFVDIKKMILTK